MLTEGVWMADASKVRQSPHSRKGGGTTPPHEKCSVGERLYSQVHVCNHARCAANDPDYNVKLAVPPRKFLVAKKHAYGGLDEKGEKKRPKGGSNTTSSDHHCDRSHALQSLTNSVLTTGSNGSNGKVRSNGLRSVVHSDLQSRRASTDNGTISSDTKKPAERNGRSTTTHASSSPGRSSLSTASRSTARKSRLSNAGSTPSPPATEQSNQSAGSSSPEGSITSIRITQIISTRREEEKEDGEDETQKLVAAATSSPTASVGSNHDNEISSWKETVIVVEEGGIFEQQTANFGDIQSPVSGSSSSNILQKNSVNEATCDAPSPSSPSVDSRPPVLEYLNPSTPSTAPERSSLTSTLVSDISSSSLRKTSVGEEEIKYDSPGPSVDSRPTTSRPLTSSVTSLKSGPRLSPTSTVRSSRTTTPSSADKLARKLLNTLKESSKIGSPLSSSSGASANKPSRISRSSVSPAPVDFSPAPQNASKLAKKFITDLQARTVARRSTKGVRSIELRGGKAQSYSTTTVTSWNVTTTTVETSVSVSEITNGKNVGYGLSPEQPSTKESRAAAAGRKASTGANLLEAPTTVKFAKNARSFEEVHAQPETVALKHGEVAERRLSEEYMTNHALEGVVKKISEQDHRVKVLVHAFETLATLTDSEALAIEEKTLNPQLVHQPLSATTIAV